MLGQLLFMHIHFVVHMLYFSICISLLPLEFICLTDLEVVLETAVIWHFTNASVMPLHSKDLFNKSYHPMISHFLLRIASGIGKPICSWLNGLLNIILYYYKIQSCIQLLDKMPLPRPDLQTHWSHFMN